MNFKKIWNVIYTELTEAVFELKTSRHDDFTF